MSNLEKAVKVISVTALGKISSFNTDIPKYNHKVVREKNKPVSNEYRELSKNISKKVEEFRKKKSNSN